MILISCGLCHSRPKSNKLVQNFKYIPSINIPASHSKYLALWTIYIVFAYHYKVVVCGLFGRVMGYDCLCNTLVHGVTTNHWFEQLVYAPILWYAFYRIAEIVFGPGEDEVLGPKVRRLKTVALFFLAMYLYGIGIHFANTIEIYSREHLGITDGPLYHQVYWVDEELSHWIQFLFYFLFFAWLIVCDRLDRNQGAYVAIYTGLLHGLERAMGVIEGDNPNTAFWYGGLLLVACFVRWRRHGSDFPRVWKDFFFRHGLTFAVSMPLAILVYPKVFGGFVQPSTMGGKGWHALVFVAVFSLVGFGLALMLDKILERTISSKAPSRQS